MTAIPRPISPASLFKSPPQQPPLPPSPCRGDVLELLDDIAELRPTIFSSVPRLWNRIYDRVMAQVRMRG